MNRIKALMLLALTCLGALVKANDITYSGGSIILGKYLQYAEDKDGRETFKTAARNLVFKQSSDESLNFGISNSTYWIKFSIVNQSASDSLFLEIDYPMLETLELFCSTDSSVIGTFKRYDVYKHRAINYHNIVFPIALRNGERKEYMIELRGKEQIVFPLILSDEKTFLSSSLLKEILTGIHIGILLVMILYNLFVYASIRERSYLYYVFYILFIGLTQTTITGYTFKYLWPSHPHFNHISIVIFPALAGTFAILFMTNFLQTKEKAPKLHKWRTSFMIIYTIAVVCRLSGLDSISYRLIDVTGLSASVYGLFISGKLTAQGFRPAKFFLVAWSIFLAGVILFVLRNVNVLPYSIFTNYTMQAGTAILVVLLSIALADKINILKKEKEASQAEALAASLENERIIREQNVVLEQKVEERTTSLKETNAELNVTLKKLKDAQSQLVDAEKMASLGQLTAGIAHEINNPINFVSSNIRPLKRDVDDILQLLATYDDLQELQTVEEVRQKLKVADKMKKDIDLDYVKEELDSLLKGMEEGANRTVEIVRGLKVFSRVDEADLKFANINEGIQSTLIILNNQMGSRMKLVKDLGNISDIECYAGKLNQVFMNILSNAIYAVNENAHIEPPTIWIKTWMPDDDHVSISMRDSGPGIPPEIKYKIFEPFFTTKDVGKGTGLGLSIVMQIIETHKGKIDVISEPGKGTEFIMTLPKLHIK
jgi:signal transduction histidine kinase